MCSSFLSSYSSFSCSKKLEFELEYITFYNGQNFLRLRSGTFAILYFGYLHFVCLPYIEFMYKYNFGIFICKQIKFLIDQLVLYLMNLRREHLVGEKVCSISKVFFVRARRKAPCENSIGHAVSRIVRYWWLSY